MLITDEDKLIFSDDIDLPLYIKAYCDWSKRVTANIMVLILSLSLLVSI